MQQMVPGICVRPRPVPPLCQTDTPCDWPSPHAGPGPGPVAALRRPFRRLLQALTHGTEEVHQDLGKVTGAHGIAADLLTFPKRVDPVTMNVCISNQLVPKTKTIDRTKTWFCMRCQGLDGACSCDVTGHVRNPASHTLYGQTLGLL